MHHHAEGLEFFPSCAAALISNVYIIYCTHIFYLSCATFRKACQVYLRVLWHAQQESADQVPGRRPFEAPVRLEAGFLCCGAR